jgi:hypothetical protein
VYKKFKSFDVPSVQTTPGDVVHYMMPATVIGSEETVGQIMALLVGSSGALSIFSSSSSANTSGTSAVADNAAFSGVVIGETWVKVRPFVHSAHAKFFAPFLLRNPGLLIFTSPEDVIKYARYVEFIFFFPLSFTFVLIPVLSIFPNVLKLFCLIYLFYFYLCCCFVLFCLIL